MKKISLGLFVLALSGGLAYFLWSGFYNQPVSEIALNQTYEGYDNFKLLKNHRWVMLINDSNYKSEDELEDERMDNYPNEVNPELTFLEGTYKKNNNKYYFRLLKSATVTFKSVKDVKKRKIFKRQIEKIKSPAYPSEPLLVKQKGTYVYKDVYTEETKNGKRKKVVKDIDVYRSTVNLPNSTEQFLKNYHKVSKKQ